MASKQVSQENGGKKPMWIYPETNGATPPERWGHSACFSEGMLYIFGGCCGGLHFSDVLALDLKSMSWASLVSTGQQPGTRDSHSAVLVGHRMIIFGGTNGSKKINDVYILDLRTQSWSHPTVKGDPPAPRESHSATLVGENKVVIFGGSGEGDGNYLNDVHILHLDNMEWTSPQVKGDHLPACRDSHTAIAIGDQLVVYGGDCGDRYLGELDILDLQTLTWTKLEMTGKIQPGVRAGHAAVTVGNKMFIFGGVGDRAYYNDVWMLDVDSRVWTPLDVSGPQPQGRFSHVAVLADNDIAVYGGCGEDERPLNEFMILCLQADQTGEDSPITKYAKSPNTHLGRRGHGSLKNTVDAAVHENGGSYPEGKNEECMKDNLRLIDLMGRNAGHVCKWKEELLKRAKRNTLDMKSEPRVATVPSSVLSLKEADNCHSPGAITASNAISSKKDSYSVLQRRIRSRKVPLPYIEQLMAQPTDNINHPELKRRKTSHLISKLDGMDSEPDDRSSSISQHSSPSHSDHEQMNHKRHGSPTKSKPLQPQFAMFLPQQSSGALAHSKYQQAQHFVPQLPHQSYQYLTQDQLSPKGDHLVRIPTLQLQVRLPAHQTMSLPVRGSQPTQSKSLPIEHAVQDSTLKTLLQQRPPSSGSGDRPQRHTNCRNKVLPNLVGSEVRGVVDGAFDSGYLMTAQLNGQVFRGLLFPHCAANGFDEANGAASIQNHAGAATIQNHADLNVAPSPQTAVIIPASLAQSSSNGTLIAYPFFPGAQFGNSLQATGITRSSVAPNPGAEITQPGKPSNTISVSCPSSVAELQRAPETSGIRQVPAPQISIPGAPKANDAHGESIHAQTGSTLPQVEMAGSIPSMIAGQGGRWVWQPVVTPTTSYPIPWAYHPLAGATSTNSIQFVAMQPIQGVAFAPAHVPNDGHASIPAAASIGTASQVGQNSDLNLAAAADIQPAVTLSLAAPGVSTPAASSPKP